MGQNGRMRWMDTIRGLAIVLVIVWHSVAVPRLYGFPMPEWVLIANNSLLPFRMPALMFLSGLLLPRSLSRPMPAYYIGKARMLVWPYILWAALHMQLYGAVAPMWHPRAWIATGYLWFLFLIACYYFLAPLIRWVPDWLVPLVFFVASVPVDEKLAVRFLYFGGFFFAGNMVARRPELLGRLVSNRWLIGVSTVLAVAVGAVSAVTDTQYQAQYAIGSLGGILAALAAARRLEGVRWLAGLQSIGRRSIVYYVSHFPVMIGCIAACTAVGLDELWVVALVNLVAALAVGALLARYRDTPPVMWLFEAPRLTAGRGGAASHVSQPDLLAQPAPTRAAPPEPATT